MRLLSLICAAASLAFAADRKPLPNQAGNDDMDIFATVLLDKAEIHQALGTDIQDGYAVVRVRVVPKAGQSLRLGTEDFTLISRKDGERSEALEPEQITGQAGLIVKAASNQPSRMSTVSNGPIWGGVRPTRSARSAADRDSDKSDGPVIPEHKDGEAGENTPEANPVLAALKAKGIPGDESKKPIEGLLYFAVEGKLKPKDLGLIYASPYGRMVVDFK